MAMLVTMIQLVTIHSMKPWGNKALQSARFVFSLRLSIFKTIASIRVQYTREFLSLTSEHLFYIPRLPRMTYQLSIFGILRNKG